MSHVFPEEKGLQLSLAGLDLTHFPDVQKNIFKYIAK